MQPLADNAYYLSIFDARYDDPFEFFANVAVLDAGRAEELLIEAAVEAFLAG